MTISKSGGGDSHLCDTLYEALSKHATKCDRGVRKYLNLRDFINGWPPYKFAAVCLKNWLSEKKPTYLCKLISLPTPNKHVQGAMLSLLFWPFFTDTFFTQEIIALKKNCAWLWQKSVVTSMIKLLSKYHGKIALNINYYLTRQIEVCSLLCDPLFWLEFLVI